MGLPHFLPKAVRVGGVAAKQAAPRAAERRGAAVAELAAALDQLGAEAATYARACGCRNHLAASVLNLCEAGGAVSAKSAAWQPATVDGDHPGDAVADGSRAMAVWRPDPGMPMNECRHKCRGGESRQPKPVPASKCCSRELLYDHGIARIRVLGSHCKAEAGPFNRDRNDRQPRFHDALPAAG